MKKILLLEDDLTLGETLKERLSQDYQIFWARSLTQARTILKQNPAMDLLILDVGLPDGSGFDLAKENSGDFSPAIIFLTAQSNAESRLLGYELGAEEFIPKPFHLKELLMRVSHVLASHLALKEIQLESCLVDFQTLSVKRITGEIEFPPVTDLKVFKVLLENSPRAMSRDELLNQIWGIDKNPNHRTIDNTIVRLKKLLGSTGERSLRSVRGVGYQWLQEETTI